MKKKGKFLNLKEPYFILQIIKKSAKMLLPLSLEEVLCYRSCGEEG